MSIAKVIEITARSPKTFEDAVERGIAKASKTVNNIQSAWVKETHVEVDGDKVAAYRVTMKITFVLD
jgi:flavin-binding protein dodecin